MPRQFMRFGEPGYPQPATIIRTQATTTGYVVMAGVNAYGAQATFVILADGEADQGLIVTIGRGAGRNGEDSNGYDVSLEDGSGTTAAVSDANRTVTLRVLNANTTFAQLKAVIDARAELSSVYFGGEDGTSTPELRDTVSENGEPGSPRKARFRINDGAAFLFFGSAAPSDDSGSALVVGRAPAWQGHLPTDAQVFIKHIGSTARTLGAELFD